MPILTNSRFRKITDQAKAGPAKGLSVRKVDRYLRFVIFLAIIGMAYIWNSHLAERQVAVREELRKEVKQLKDDYYLKEASLNAGIRYSEMAAMTDTLGLKKLNTPPYRLVSEKHKNESSQD